MTTGEFSSFAIDMLAGPGAPDGVVIRSDLLPPSTHGSNIRGIVDKNVWDALRIPVCSAAGNRCEICGSQTVRNGRPSRPDCHEKWVFGFRDRQPVQRLSRLIALCPGCHQAQHSGLARVQGREHEVIDRLRRLNNWTEAQADQDLNRSSDRCMALDRFAWELDLSVLRGRLIVNGYPDLHIPAADRARLGNSFFGTPPAGQAGLS
jgi:hypothetical protein